jgi:formylglycine-generating enzyme required for sulfatase activity
MRPTSLLAPCLAASVAAGVLWPSVAGGQGTASSPTTYRETIPGTLVTFEMALVPGGPGVKPFHIGRTEVTWDLYDVFALGLDAPRAGGGNADAVARPSRPYGAPDYGWGHAGYPAISIAREAADAFTAWLSAKTGKQYRLPTEAEWEHAATLAGPPSDAVAWHRGNATSRTRPVASRAPDALGLFDLFGNAAEWVAAPDGARVTRGGSFRDPLAALGPAAREEQDDSWNERDPQLPKSQWWLSDAPFVGFRLARDIS